MEQPIDLQEHSQRLRYEAFSHFATLVGKADTVEQLGQVLARHAKFILDAYLLRLLHVYEHRQLVWEVCRGECATRQNGAGGLLALEQELLSTGLPRQINATELAGHPALKNSFFNHPKTTHLFALPIAFSASHQTVITVASKEAKPYGQSDFRLVRLIAELLAGKLAQLLLAQQVASKNEQLAEANEELATLNDEIKELNSYLEQKVEERTSQLQQANWELSTIFYRSSHDFRRPLTTLLGLLNLSEMATQQMSRAASGELQACLSLYQQGRTVIAELDGMLAKLSTLSLLEGPLLDKPIDWPQLLEAMRQKFEPQLSAYGIDFSVSTQLSEPFYGDRRVLSAIVDNLIENAIQFRGIHPAINLLIYRESQKACPGIREAPVGCGRPQQGDCLVLSVSDNGEGIAPQWHKKIFDLYVRASERARGNGLGLYVVKKLVILLGGQVTLSSEPQQGSEFTVRLPYRSGSL